MFTGNASGLEPEKFYNVKEMLANSRTTALKYTKDPYLICRSEEPFEEVYWVPDSNLPALNVKCDPMSLISKSELYQLKKKFRISNRILARVTECYKRNNPEFDFGDMTSLESSLFVSELEDRILSKVKERYRCESCNFLPFYNKDELGQKCLHTQIVGGSSAGKSYVTSAIIRANFEGSDIFVFSPTATKDKSWTDLRKDFGKKCRLIDSNTVSIQIPLEEFPRGFVLCVDDIDSTSEPAKTYISLLQRRCLFEGRHYANSKGQGCIVFGIYHDSFAVGSNTSIKSAQIESSRVILFPLLNRSICTKFLSKRLHWTTKEIKKAYDFIKKNDRWMTVYTHVPNLLMTAHGVLLL